MSVIISHVFLIWPNAEVMHFKIVSFRQIFMFAVPLFLMLTGALLLNREIEIKDFFKRRMSRIITPFVFYLIIYLVALYVIMGYAGYGSIAEYLYKIPFEYNWYFWLVLGVYICLPVINIFVRHASQKEIEYFVAVIFLGSIFYQVTYILQITHYVNLNLFLLPLAYVVLGYYLANKDFRISKNKIMTLSILLIIIVTVIKVVAVDGMIPFEYVTGYDITETSRVATRVDVGIFELIRVSSIFLLFRFLFESESGIYARIRNAFENSLFTNLYTSISRASYGMYLFHRTIFTPVEIALAGAALTGSQTCVLILALCVVSNLISWIVVLVISKIPFINRFSGYH